MNEKVNSKIELIGVCLIKILPRQTHTGPYIHIRILIHTQPYVSTDVYIIYKYIIKNKINIRNVRGVS